MFTEIQVVQIARESELKDEGSDGLMAASCCGYKDLVEPQCLKKILDVN